MDRPHVAHPVQQPPEEVRRVGLGVCLALLAVPGREARRRAIEASRVDEHGGGGRLLEAAANGCGHAELAGELPAQALPEDPPDPLVLALAPGLHVAQVLRQLAEVVGQEGGEVGQVAQLRAPVVLEGLGRLVQGQRIAGVDHCLHGGAQVDPEGAPAEEAGAVAGVLHRVGERQELLVVVERALEELADGDRRQARRTGAHDGQRVVRATGGAAGREPLVAPVLLRGDLQQNRPAARRAFTVGGHRAVQARLVRVEPVHQLGRPLLLVQRARPDEAGVAVVLEPGLPHGAGGDRDPALVPVGLGAHRSDAVDAALTAVGLRCVQTFRLGLAGHVGPPGEAGRQQRAVSLVRERPQQAGELAGPELDLHGQQGAGGPALVALRVADQGQEAGEQEPPDGHRELVPLRHAIGQGLVYGLEGGRAGGRHRQQVVEQGVGAQRLAQGQRLADLAQPEGLLGLEPLPGVVEPVRVQRLLARGRDRGTGARGEQEVGPCHPPFAHDVGSLEGLVEDLAGEGGELVEGVGLGGRADGRRGSGADEVFLGGLEPVLEAPDQAADVGALGSVEGVQLVDDQVAQGFRRVVLPQPPLVGPQQHEVEHLVVGQQDVGRLAAQRLLVLDEVVSPHVRRESLVAAADVQGGADLAAQPLVAVDEAGQSAGLVGRQGVHRVDEDRLHPRGALVPEAVVEDGVEEALGLARAGARGDQRVARRGRASGVELTEGLQLVGIGREPRPDGQWVGFARAGDLEGQAEPQVGAAEQAVGATELSFEGGGEGGVVERQRGQDVVDQRVLELGGDDRRDHGSLPTPRRTNSA